MSLRRAPLTPPSQSRRCRVFTADWHADVAYRSGGGGSPQPSGLVNCVGPGLRWRSGSAAHWTLSLGDDLRLRTRPFDRSGPDTLTTTMKSFWWCAVAAGPAREAAMTTGLSEMRSISSPSLRPAPSAVRRSAASVSPDVYTLTVGTTETDDVAPVAKFKQPISRCRKRDNGWCCWTIAVGENGCSTGNPRRHVLAS